MPERTGSPLDRPIARALIAAILLAALAGAYYALTRDSGDGVQPLASATPAPGVTETPLGALDDRPPIKGDPAPDFILAAPDGTTTRLSDLRGSVVFVNFWATWCRPCKQELPDIERVYAEKGEHGLEVLAVNYDEASDDATAYFRENNIDLPMLLDSDGEVYRQYRLQGLPDSFFVDRDGNIAAVYYGYLSDERMREKLAEAGLP